MVAEQDRTVMVVDEVPSVIRLLELELNLEGWRVVTSKMSDDPLEVIDRERPDVVLLEVILPGLSGFELMSEIHERHPATPIVFLTSEGTEADRAYGFELGAADYITKPFSPMDLHRRLMSVIGQAPRGQPEIIRCGDVDIDLSRQVARKGPEIISLGTNEWALLLALARHKQAPTPATEMLTVVWGETYANDPQALEIWVNRLRRKLEPDPAHPSVITGDASTGYVLHARRPE